MALLDTTLPVGWDSSLESIEGREIELAQDLTIRIMEISGQTVYRGVLVFPFMTTAQKDTLVTFYNANKDLQWTFQYPKDDEVYDLYFVGTLVPERDPEESTRWIARVSVVGTQQ